MHEHTWIKRYIAPLVTAPGADGLNDDVAILSTAASTIVTMDTIVAGVHFLPDDGLETVGQKLLRVNISDIFSKGAEPIEAVLSIAWPRGRDEAEFGNLIAGIERDLKTYGVSLVGGDLVSIEGPLTLTMMMTGQCLNAGPVRRSGGSAGQGLYIDGEIGWGGVGLQAAKSGGAADDAARYRVPEISPRASAETVASHAAASMDVSDGLLIDAARLAESSGCGALLDLDCVPLAKSTENIDDILNLCVAGDDYRILISAADDVDLPGFTRIGVLTKAPGLQLRYRGQAVNPPSTLGFEH